LRQRDCLKGVIKMADLASQIKIKPAWYVIHTYYNTEKRVKERIDYLADKYPGLVFRAEIPTIKKTLNKNGKIKQIEEKLFPGYVFIKAVLTDSVRSAIRSINGVTGFVGPGGEPTPITPAEVVRTGIADRADEEFKTGETVIITDGPFENFIGKITKIEGRNISVSLNMFGRDIEISFSGEQLEKL